MPRPPPGAPPLDQDLVPARVHTAPRREQSHTHWKLKGARTFGVVGAGMERSVARLSLSRRSSGEVVVAVAVSTSHGAPGLPRAVAECGVDPLIERTGRVCLAPSLIEEDRRIGAHDDLRRRSDTDPGAGIVWPRSRCSCEATAPSGACPDRSMGEGQGSHSPDGALLV